MDTTSTYEHYFEYASTDDAEFGYSVSLAGDVNGDGYDDVVVGAYLSNLKAGGAGAAFIYYGGPSMSTTSTYDVYLEYASIDQAYFGKSVSSAGDVNGDGYDDVVIGAHFSDLKAPQAGAAFIYHGGPAMPTTSTYNIYLEYASIDGGGAGNFGSSVSSAGDVNGDGYDDVVVGAYLSNLKAGGAGAAFIYHGGPSMDTTSTYNIYLEYASTDDASFGISVSSAGDVNGDGYDDVVVGAYFSDLKASSAGAAFIYHGGPSMQTTSTYNIYLEYASTDTNAYFGYSVSSAGDVNGDGYDDVIVGAYGSDLKATSVGAAFIYYGGPSMSTTSTYNIYLEYASTDDAYFGSSVSSAGDVNGDGYDDVVVGAYVSGLKATQAGAAFIYHGGPSMQTTSTYNIYLEYASTDTNAYFGRSVSSAGDINGDGYDDLVVGAYRSDLKAEDAGAVFLHMGAKSISSPYFYFAQKVSGTPGSIDATWNGQSSVAASTKNLKLDVYRFGASNQWENATTNSTCVLNTDCTLSKSITSNVSDYYDSGWTYWRAYQESDNQILKSDYFNIDFTLPDLTQRAYIFRSDDGGRGYGGTDMSSANTTSTDIKIGQRMIVRIQVDNIEDATSTAVYKLQYDKNDDNWTDVRREGEIHYNRSYSGRDEETIPYPAAGSCQGGTTWTDGEFYENRNRTDAFILGPNKCTEFGFLIDTSNSLIV